MDPWRWILTFGADPAFNMGLDEALLVDASAPPTFRVYGWDPGALSLGYFQRFADVPGAASARSVVRRITGGGAIHHVRELTFSLAAPAGHPVFEGPIVKSYERVHGAIAHALARHGVEAMLRGEGATLDSDQDGTGMCFHASTALDLAWGGRKGVGSAQRRKGGRVLHHGSIKLAASKLEAGVATVDQGDPDVTPDSLARTLGEVFGVELGMTLDRTVPSPEEREAARELGERYADPAFVRRR